MVLNVLCAHGIVALPQVVAMGLRLGLTSAPENWDEILKHIVLSSDPANDHEYDYGEMSGLPGAYGENLWGNADWVAEVSRPDQNFDIAAAFRRHLPAMV